MQLGAAFDASYINGKSGCGERDLCVHNTCGTKHDKNLEDDYKLLRENGFRFFRDSAYPTFTWNGKKANWAYLDRLARLSKGDIQLSISHYESIENAEKFSELLARRYKGVFHSYIPVVESGYWAAMLGEWKRWYPIKDGWWDAWNTHISPLISSIISGLKSGDSNCRIASAEPWNYNEHVSFEHQNTPFEFMKEHLDIIGLNIYHPYYIELALREAKRLYPNKEIMITETGNCHNQHIDIRSWIDMMESEITKSDVEITQTVWSPVLQMLNFEQGEPTVGHLFDLDRKTIFNRTKFQCV